MFGFAIDDRVHRVLVQPETIVAANRSPADLLQSFKKRSFRTRREAAAGCRSFPSLARQEENG